MRAAHFHKRGLMRICILYGGTDAGHDKLKGLAEGMSKGISSSGEHIVEILDMKLEQGRRISSYDYVVIISQAESLFSKKVPSIVSDFLKAAGSISGKRCSCFISSNCLRKNSVLHNLMYVMESEGMYLKLSDVLKNADMAYAVGKRLHVERN